MTPRQGAIWTAATAAAHVAAWMLCLVAGIFAFPAPGWARLLGPVIFGLAIGSAQWLAFPWGQVSPHWIPATTLGWLLGGEIRRGFIALLALAFAGPSAGASPGATSWAWWECAMFAGLPAGCLQLFLVPRDHRWSWPIASTLAHFGALTLASLLLLPARIIAGSPGYRPLDRAFEGLHAGTHGVIVGLLLAAMLALLPERESVEL